MPFLTIAHTSHSPIFIVYFSLQSSSMGIKPLTLPLAIVRWSSYHVSISLAIIPFHSKKLPWGLTFSCFVPFAHTRSWHYIALPVGHSLKGKVTPNLWQCGFCQEAQETTKHVLWSCPFAQQVWNKVMSLSLTINCWLPILMGISDVGSVTFQLDAIWGKRCSWGNEST